MLNDFDQIFSISRNILDSPFGLVGSVETTTKASSFPVYFFFLNFFLMFIYFWDRDRVWAGGGAEREGDTKSKAGSRLWTVSTEPNAGLELTNCKIKTWAKVGCLTYWATQVPPSTGFETKRTITEGASSKSRSNLDDEILDLQLDPEAVMGWDFWASWEVVSVFCLRQQYVCSVIRGWTVAS